MIILPIYVGRFASKTRAENIPSEVDVTLFIVAMLLGREEKMVVLQVIRTPHMDWQGQILDMIVHSAKEFIERIVETLKIERHKPWN